MESFALRRLYYYHLAPNGDPAFRTALGELARQARPWAHDQIAVPSVLRDVLRIFASLWGLPHPAGSADLWGALRRHYFRGGPLVLWAIWIQRPGAVGEVDTPERLEVRRGAPARSAGFWLGTPFDPGWRPPPPRRPRRHHLRMSDEPRVARQMRWLFQAAARSWTWGEIAAAERQSPSGLHFSPETVRTAVRTLG
ncbi:MAG TPA: hypothetical protein VMT79_22335 [Candidatus Binatia bacterium]|nr:hypothetical protein [Candidatus Binatia bacterium]